MVPKSFLGTSFGSPFLHDSEVARVALSECRSTGIPAHEKVRCQEQRQLNGAPGQRLASTAGGVTVERPERAVAREDERP